VPNNKEGQHPTGITRETANIFLGILLALILTATLDTVCREVPHYKRPLDLLHALRSDLEAESLIAIQVIVFLFTVTRFYWGTVRYHDEVRGETATGQFFFGFVGTVVVFSIFYVTAQVVENPGLFYASLCVALTFDFLWFSGAVWRRKGPRIPETGCELQTIWGWYLLFDFVTIVPVTALQFVARRGARIAWWCDLFSLAVISGVGIWDMKKFWPYYIKRVDRKVSPGVKQWMRSLISETH
jgi:hypothetical protein